MSKTGTAARGRRAPPPGAGPERALKELTRLFKSLADESRLRILVMLARDGEMHVSAIGDELGQSQPSVSHHLNQLRNAGLVDFRRDGKFNYYSLNPEAASGLLELLFPSGPAKVTFPGVEISFKARK